MGSAGVASGICLLRRDWQYVPPELSRRTVLQGGSLVLARLKEWLGPVGRLMGSFINLEMRK